MKCAQKTMLIFEQNVELGNMHKVDIDKKRYNSNIMIA